MPATKTTGAGVAIGVYRPAGEPDVRPFDLET